MSAPFAWHRPVMPCRRPAMRQFWGHDANRTWNRSGKGTDHASSVFALALMESTHKWMNMWKLHMAASFSSMMCVVASSWWPGARLARSLQDHFGTLARYWSAKHVERQLRAQIELNWRTRLLMILDRCVLVVGIVSQQQIYQGISGVERGFASNMKINL